MHLTSLISPPAIPAPTTRAGVGKETGALKPLLSGIAAFAPKGSHVTVLSETVTDEEVAAVCTKHCTLTRVAGSAASRADLLKAREDSGFVVPSRVQSVEQAAGACLHPTINRGVLAPHVVRIATPPQAGVHEATNIVLLEESGNVQERNAKARVRKPRRRKPPEKETPPAPALHAAGTLTVFQRRTQHSPGYCGERSGASRRFFLPAARAADAHVAAHPARHQGEDGLPGPRRRRDQRRNLRGARRGNDISSCSPHIRPTLSVCHFSLPWIQARLSANRAVISAVN